MKPNHTPGPWFAHYATACAEQADGEYMDAIAITTNSEPDYVRTASRGHLVAFAPYEGDKRGIERGEANARLIAAAPAMRAALERAVFQLERFNVVHGDTASGPALDEARAALAAADKGAP